MMKNLGQFILELKNFLPQEDSLRLHMLAKKHFKFVPAQINSQTDTGLVDKKIRDTEVVNLSNSEIEKSMTNVFWANYLVRKFSEAIKVYGKTTETGFTVQITDIQLLKYNNEGFYNTHVDDGKFTERRLSLVYLINDDYDGGELCFATSQNKNEHFPIKVESNKLIIFPSNFLFPHGVQKVTKGIKYSVVSWAR